eukprot:GILI01002143.1.p1 GENE.GILI01002143.1~~GILI01002143.1.p1  ORF type:complete len:427 (-),score=103.06 GILI01002143.1:219-1499(-)
MARLSSLLVLAGVFLLAHASLARELTCSVEHLMNIGSYSDQWMDCVATQATHGLHLLELPPGLMLFRGSKTNLPQGVVPGEGMPEEEVKDGQAKRIMRGSWYSDFNTAYKYAKSKRGEVRVFQVKQPSLVLELINKDNLKTLYELAVKHLHKDRAHELSIALRLGLGYNVGVPEAERIISRRSWAIFDHGLVETLCLLHREAKLPFVGYAAPALGEDLAPFHGRFHSEVFFCFAPDNLRSIGVRDVRALSWGDVDKEIKESRDAGGEDEDEEEEEEEDGRKRKGYYDSSSDTESDDSDDDDDLFGLPDDEEGNITPKTKRNSHQNNKEARERRATRNVVRKLRRMVEDGKTGNENHFKSKKSHQLNSHSGELKLENEEEVKKLLKQPTHPPVRVGRFLIRGLPVDEDNGKKAKEAEETTEDNGDNF